VDVRHCSPGLVSNWCQLASWRCSRVTNLPQGTCTFFRRFLSDCLKSSSDGVCSSYCEGAPQQKGPSWLISWPISPSVRTYGEFSDGLKAKVLGHSSLPPGGLLILLALLLSSRRRRNLRAQYYGDVYWLHSLIHYLRKIFAQLLQIGFVSKLGTKRF